MIRQIKQIIGWSLLTLFTCPVVSAQITDSIQPGDRTIPFAIEEIPDYSLSTDSDQTLLSDVGGLPTDTTQIVTDTVPKSSNAVDAPVHYAAKDSIMMSMRGKNMIYMYGEGSVQYKNLDLTGEYIEVDADKSTVYATFAVDSVGEEFGYPVFKEGDTQYEMKKARYNFETKKMYINDVISQQGGGYMTAGKTKKMANDELFTENARYTTCDDHEHPHFYLQLTKAKLRPGKDIVTGPAYLVVEDVPLPVALPFAFFPFPREYSSGIIMPTFDDELKRGFSLQNGGYYFAINDYMDLALTGDIYTRGSWGLDALSQYQKRYKFSGRVHASYLVTVSGEKGEPDYSKSKDFRLDWSHSQDQRANPFSTFSANVAFSTTSFTQNDLPSRYSGASTNNTTSSSISYSYRPPGSIFSFSASASVNQTKRDTTLSVTLPNMNITMREIFPFQRKERVGALRWYENVRMSYTSTISNSIRNVKEYDFFNKKLIGDWNNGIRHQIPISASFNLFKTIAITPSINYQERWYSSKVNHRYDYELGREVPVDTVMGFYRIYDYSASVSAQTTVYGRYQPLSIFGEWTKKIDIRHVMKPSISFSGSPDFSDKRYGYYKDLIYNNNGQLDTLRYSPFKHNLWGVPNMGRSGTLSFSLDNNLEMKVPIAGTDSTRKISLIDQLQFSTGYNFLVDSLQWRDISVTLRIKLPKALNNHTLSLSSVFDVYEYGENGERINSLRWKKGSIGRFRGITQTIPLRLSNETVKKWFTKKEKEEGDDTSGESTDQSDLEGVDAIGSEEGVASPGRTSLRKPKTKDGDYDTSGYLLVDIPWSINMNYSIGYAYDLSKFNKEKREYPYRLTQTLGIQGEISPTKNWKFSFTSGYDFDNKRFTHTTINITREMHCWTMTASVIPVGLEKSYMFSIAVSSPLLKDLKYDQSSSSSEAMGWGY